MSLLSLGDYKQLCAIKYRLPGLGSRSVHRCQMWHTASLCIHVFLVTLMCEVAPFPVMLLDVNYIVPYDKWQHSLVLKL